MHERNNEIEVKEKKYLLTVFMLFTFKSYWKYMGIMEIKMNLNWYYDSVRFDRSGKTNWDGIDQ